MATSTSEWATAGRGGDPENRAQNLSDLLGKILRIDVNAGSPYAVPSNNPFVGTAGARTEIWALGLRNPWRFSFDRLTGDLFIGDVGQSAREEVNLQPSTSRGGENYGWRRMEGNACYNPSSACNDGTLTLPILDYTHDNGDCTVIGGYRYRGTQAAGLAATYIYGDFCTGRIWGASTNGQLWGTTLLLDLPFLISTFGEDQGGELYVAAYAATGAIYRIKDAASASLTVNGSSASLSLAGGSPVTLQVQNAPGSPTDCITLDFLDFHGFDGVHHQFFTWVTGSTMTTSFVMPTAPGVYAARYWQGCATQLAISPTVTVQAAPTLTINGSSAPLTLAGGTTVTLQAQNAPGSPTDCITLDFLDFHGFDGVHHQFFTWVTANTMTLSFAMPTAPGVYAARYWQGCVTQLAISPTVTVQSTGGPSLTVNGSSAPLSLAGGTTVTLQAQNAPGSPTDCITLDFLDFQGFDGVHHQFFTWVTGSTMTLSFAMPTAPGVYAARYWQGCATQLAISPTVTVQ